MQAQRWSQAWPARRIACYAIPILLGTALLFALIILPVLAAGVNGSGNWIDWTSYCGSGVCVPVSANHKANVHVEYYYVDSYHRVTYWEDFGGSVYPESSLCGYHDWVKGSTYYETSNGNVTISGWFETPVWCPSGKVCRNYHSDTDYWLNCPSCKGRFKSLTWFTTRCIPCSGPTHTTSVTF